MAGNKAFTPRQVLDAFYEAERIYTSAPPSERTFDTIAATLSSDFYMEQSSALPWAGVYHGPSGLQKWINHAADWVVIDVRKPEVFEREGSDKVVVLSTIWYRCHKTGKELEFPLSQTFVIDWQEGKIKEIRSFYWDIKALNEAMGYTGSGGA